jgi:hypothetical protein
VLCRHHHVPQPEVHVAKKHHKGVPHDEHDESRSRKAPEQPREEEKANPPRTTTGPLTAPKFGSAGSGGAELEPGPKKN